MCFCLLNFLANNSFTVAKYKIQLVGRIMRMLIYRD
jgi:hypothetical protein